MRLSQMSELGMLVGKRQQNPGMQRACARAFAPELPEGAVGQPHGGKWSPGVTFGPCSYPQITNRIDRRGGIDDRFIERRSHHQGITG